MKPLLSLFCTTAFIWVLLAYTVAVRAEEPAQGISACFAQAAERHNIPAELLVSIAEVESGMRPYALNRGGSAILPRSREEAERSVEIFSRQSVTFDIGIMQVNRWWFEKYGESYSKGLDPCFNIDFGARILAMAIKDHGFTWQAVGRYHSPTGWRQSAYAQKIFNRLARLLEKRKATPLARIIGGKEAALVLNRQTEPPAGDFPAASTEMSLRN
jgi:soluble lytic murein transglycosylase-like protein